MANQSSSADQSVASFEYNPADAQRQPLTLHLTRPLDDLEEMLLEDFADRTITIQFTGRRGR